MSFCASVTDKKFFVPVEHTGRFLALAKKIPWDFEVDDEGNVVKATLISNKLGNDFEIFQKMAPYIKDGSFFEFLYENGSKCRWVFKDGICKEVWPETVWPDEE